jgi:hypothetical protein
VRLQSVFSVGFPNPRPADYPSTQALISSLALQIRPLLVYCQSATLADSRGSQSQENAFPPYRRAQPGRSSVHDFVLLSDNNGLRIKAI